MNTQDRAVVKALLQSMTNSCLFHTDEFRAALKHFNITTTYSGQQVSDEAATLLGKEKNHFVDVFYPDNVDTEPYGVRFWFDSKAEARYYEQLKWLLANKQIKSFRLQPRYTLLESFKKNGKTFRKTEYIADFEIIHLDGSIEVIDVKGYETPVFALKRKLFEKMYPDHRLSIVTYNKTHGWIELDKLKKIRKKVKKNE